LFEEMKRWRVFRALIGYGMTRWRGAGVGQPCAREAADGLLQGRSGDDEGDAACE